MLVGADCTLTGFTAASSTAASEEVAIPLGTRIRAVNGVATETKTALVAALSDESLQTGQSVEFTVELPDTELVLRSHRAQPTQAAVDPAKAKMAEGIARLANASFLSGGFEQALQAYGEALSLSPDDGKLLLARAQCYIKVGEGASEATAETMYALATVDAEVAAQHMPDAAAAARAHAARAEALYLLQRHEEAEQALGLALAGAPSDAAVLQAQTRMHSPATRASASPAPAPTGGRFSKMLGRRAPAPAPEPEIQQVSASSLHVVAPAQRPSDAVVEMQLSQVLDEMGLPPGSLERGAVETLAMDKKWAMVEAATAKRVVDQSTKAQEYAAAQAALKKRSGPGGAAGFIERKVAALTGDSGTRDGAGEGEGVGTITHWDGSSSVVDPRASRASDAAASASGGTGGSDTRWMCVEPDISWRRVEFLEAEDVTDTGSSDADGAVLLDADTSHYIIYRLRAHTVDGRKWEVAKRYSEFVGFREELLAAGLAISHLSFPPKTTWSLAGRTNERLVARRMTQLQAWMTALIETYPDHVLIGVFLHADSDLAQLETLRMKWSQPDRAMTYRPHGWSPLHTAAQRGDLAAIEDAIEEGFLALGRGMASSDEEGDDAASSGREALMLDVVDYNGQTPLHRAAALGHADIVFALLGGGASPAVVSCSGHTALHTAAKEGNASIVSQLCVATKAPAQATGLAGSLDIPSQTGDTALHYAVVATHKNAVQVLLDQGANPHMTNMLADTPLDALVRAHGLTPDGQSELSSPLVIGPADDSDAEPAQAQEVMQMLQQAMRDRPAPAPRPPPRPPTQQQQQQQQQEEEEAASNIPTDAEARSSVALARAAVQSGAGSTLRCVSRTTVREGQDLRSRKVGSLPVGSTVTAHETVEIDDGTQLRFRIGRLGQLNGWVSLHSTKSGALLFEALPEAPERATPSTSPEVSISPRRPTWEYSRDLSRACANGSLWCSAKDMRSAAAALHAFYQENCLGGAGATQLLASPRSAQGDAGVSDGGDEPMNLYDDDSWLQDDLDSPVSIRSDSDSGGASPSASPLASDGRASPVSPASSMGTPVAYDALDIAADAVGKFAPAARTLFLQAIASDQDGSSDSAAVALDLYTQGLQAAMAVVRGAQDKEPMKKALEPYFARAFSLRGDVAAAKTAKAVAAAAMAKKKAGPSAIAEGIPPSNEGARPQPLTLSPAVRPLPAPKPGDPAYDAFVSARQALKGTLRAPPASGS
jgi:tetratricopeptide (TPR) repeat protein